MFSFPGISTSATASGEQIDHLLALTHWYLLAMFASWLLLFFYILFRFQKSRNPRAIYDGGKARFFTQFQIVAAGLVVITELALLFGWSMPIWRARSKMPPANSQVVRVIAQQFAWDFQYPADDGKFGRWVISGGAVKLDSHDSTNRENVIAHELHVVVGQPVVIKLSSIDVIHSLVIERMRVAQDAIPGMEITIWFTPLETGTFPIICGQLCGYDHYAMHSKLVVENALEHRIYLQKMRAQSAKDGG